MCRGPYFATPYDHDLMKRPPGTPEGKRNDVMDALHKGPDQDRVQGQKENQHLDHDQDQDPDHDPASLSGTLPSGRHGWRDSVLGQPKGWSLVLQSYARTLSSFAYPAGIFWGEELVLLHNNAWIGAGGKALQGQSQHGYVGADTIRALSSALHGGQQKMISSRDLLRSGSENQAERFTVLISPLFADDGPEAKAVGLLAQMLPKHDDDAEEGSKDRATPGITKAKVDHFAKDGTIDRVPLDEHPFFHRFAEMLPSGLAILDHKAHAVFVNQHFYALTTHKGDHHSFTSWPQSIHPDDYPRVMAAYQEAFDSGKQLRTEFRSLGDDNPWRLLLLMPLGDDNLQHVSLREYGGFICSLVDITSEKRAEISERKAAQAAEARRGQQERFIDMISHEIRNPLSAVMHSTEDIEEAISNEEHIEVRAIREAVETINLCLQHQRNIVDDVLSYSKLDASMLSLVPRACRPTETLVNTLKMFHPEFRKQGLQFDFKIDNTYVEYKIDWVMADTSRVGQILINLISNAIKFTARANGKKRITVMVGASLVRPTSYPPNLVFFSSDEALHMDHTNAKEWGHGETLYIMVAVKDTGIGISGDGQKRLFERFRQATPKTSDTYGGSGLGLNISRKLCHLHGGEVGVSSKEGSGSTFGFFFRAKRADNPGSYHGRSEQHAIDEEKLEDLIQAQGYTADKASENVAESITNPAIEDTIAAPPDRSPQKDDRYAQTVRVAKQVEASEPDPYTHLGPSSATEQSQSAEPAPQNRSEATEMPSRPGMVHSDSQGRPKVADADKSPAKCHVLLVEDNIINQRIVHRKLTSKGFEVTTANQGREAVDAVIKASRHTNGENQSAFDIILMDQEMPVLDGNAATRELCELADKGEVERIPILGVTANVRATQQDEMVNAGMDDVISKPYKVDDLIRKIDEVTGKSGKSDKV
ncbi:hypothetical protein LTR74_006458 [Friedmanniomyces endolithicus]|nr:hypothetical protein LTR74_006458 [Friedmanniomyces endolithicus]